MSGWYSVALMTACFYRRGVAATFWEIKLCTGVLFYTTAKNMILLMRKSLDKKKKGQILKMGLNVPLYNKL